MTQAEKLVKIIMPDLLRYLKMKESGEIAQKRLDKLKNPIIMFLSWLCRGIISEKLSQSKK